MAARANFIAYILKNASLRELFGFMLVRDMFGLASEELKSRATNGKLKDPDVEYGITLFSTIICTSVGDLRRKSELEVLFSLLQAEKYEFSRVELRKLLSAFGQGYKLSPNFRSVVSMFLKKVLADENSVLDILDLLPNVSRVYLFEQAMNILPRSEMFYFKSLKYGQVASISLSKLQDWGDLAGNLINRKEAKEHLLLALQNKEVRTAAFNLLLKLKMLSEDDLKDLAIRGETRKLAKEALRNGA